MLRRSKKVKGLVFNITSAYEYAEIEFTNPYEPKGINVNGLDKTNRFKYVLT